jgi:branched-subunit amino acid ABC-type transport system permease component
MSPAQILNPNDLAVFALNGLSLGMILFMMASGLTLIFGLIGLVNFAHGVLFTLGGYLTMVTVSYTGSYWLGIIVGTIVVGTFGLVLERTLLNHLYDEVLLGFLATFGIWLVLEEMIRFIWGGQGYSVKSPLSGSTTMLGFSYSTHRLFIIVVGILVVALIGGLLRYTRIGLEIHATATNADTAETLGIPTSKINSLVFFIGIALAALAGGLITPVTSVFPTLGIQYMLIAFLIVIVGGMGSFVGSFVASIAIGLITSFGTLVLAPTYVNISVFVLAMIFILVRPNGIFGTTGVLE